MKNTIKLLLILISFTAFGQVTNYKLLTDEASDAYVPASAWYWDPNKPGMGLNVTIQRSKNSASGYFVFAAFYTHNSDGSQAWYTVQGAYEPNPNPSAWRERGVFGRSIQNTVSGGVVVEGAGGNYWGSDGDAWMGQIDTVLYKSLGGMALGRPHRPNTIAEYKPIKMVWLNPHEIDIYLDGESSASQTFKRQNLHGDIVNGDADYLTNNYFKMLGLQHGLAPNGEDVRLRYISSTISFEKIDPMSYFNTTANIEPFLNATEYSATKSYYISHAPVGQLEGVYNQVGEGGDDVFATLEGQPRGTKWVVLTYDTANQMVDGFYMLHVQDGPKDGLFPFMGDYKFKGYLPAEDQGRISLYPAACAHCNGTTDKSFTKELTRRSAWHLFKIPDDTGIGLGKLPDVHVEGFNIESE